MDEFSISSPFISNYLLKILYAGSEIGYDLSEDRLQLILHKYA